MTKICGRVATLVCQSNLSMKKHPRNKLFLEDSFDVFRVLTRPHMSEFQERVEVSSFCIHSSHHLVIVWVTVIILFFVGWILPLTHRICGVGRGSFAGWRSILADQLIYGKRCLEVEQWCEKKYIDMHSSFCCIWQQYWKVLQMRNMMKITVWNSFFWAVGLDSLKDTGYCWWLVVSSHGFCVRHRG